ncbi:MAG: tetratricopeptide repeat protein [Deltaproteobacteria bacterium]|nr:tetratricopeptide repeat protein [Deltaproteobacteria bacterium]
MVAGPEPSAANRLGRYELESPLEDPDSFAARDFETGRPVVVRIIRVPRDTLARRRLRLLREAQALCNLAHPRLERVIEVGSVGSDFYLVTHRPPSQRLDQWLSARRRSRREIWAVLEQAGEALEAAHGAGIVHRDFGLHRVRVARDTQALVVDFGLARLAARPETLAADSSPYLAPEQRAGRSADPSSDQYAFCALLLHALTGGLPTGGAPASRDLPESLLQVLLRGMSTDPRHRHRSMRSLLDVLRAEHQKNRRGVARLILAAVAGSLIALSAGTVLGARAQERSVTRARAEDDRRVLETAARAARATREGDPRSAAELLKDAEARFALRADRRLQQARLIHNRGRALARAGSFAAAIEALDRAAAIERSLGAERASLAAVLEDRALVSASLGRLEAAVEIAREALSVRQAVHGSDAPETASALQALAATLLAAKDPSGAVGAAARALRIISAQGGPETPEVIEAGLELGWLQLLAHAPEAARATLEDARAWAERAGRTEQEARALRGLGAAELELGDLPRAIDRLERAVALLAPMANPVELARARFALAEALARDPASLSRAQEEARAALSALSGGDPSSPEQATIQRWILEHPP